MIGVSQWKSSVSIVILTIFPTNTLIHDKNLNMKHGLTQSSVGFRPTCNGLNFQIPSHHCLSSHCQKSDSIRCSSMALSKSLGCIRDLERIMLRLVTLNFSKELSVTKPFVKDLTGDIFHHRPTMSGTKTVALTETLENLKDVMNKLKALALWKLIQN